MLSCQFCSGRGKVLRPADLCVYCLEERSAETLRVREEEETIEPMTSEADRHYRKTKFDGQGRELIDERPTFQPLGNERTFLEGAAQDRSFIAEPECRGLAGRAMAEYVRCRRMGQEPQAAREGAMEVSGHAGPKQAPLVMPRPSATADAMDEDREELRLSEQSRKAHPEEADYAESLFDDLDF